MPLWMVTQTGKPDMGIQKRGIIFLDEYGQGEADTKRASAELLLKTPDRPVATGWCQS